MFVGEFFRIARGHVEVVLGDGEVDSICRSRYLPAGLAVAESLNGRSTSRVESRCANSSPSLPARRSMSIAERHTSSFQLPSCRMLKDQESQNVAVEGLTAKVSPFIFLGRWTLAQS